MNNPFLSRVGGVISADIAVPEHERALRFYSRVLSTGDTPCWREDLMNSRGTPVIGLGARTAELEHLPIQWMPHIQVADVGASAERAVARGGRELMHGKNDQGESQWAVLLDPDGAAFGLIPVVPPGAMPAATSEDSPDGAAGTGHIAWLDLTVPGASAAREFYSDVVGWSVEEVGMNDAGESYADYNMLGGDGTPAAGICHGRGVNLGIPPVWLIYLPVGDLAESVRRAVEEGGRVLKENRRGDGTLTGAVIEDPAGACLAIGPG